MLISPRRALVTGPPEGHDAVALRRDVGGDRERVPVGENAAPVDGDDAPMSATVFPESVRNTDAPTVPAATTRSPARSNATTSACVRVGSAADDTARGHVGELQLEPAAAHGRPAFRPD